ncbi:MAG: twin-arginine translocation signal domain-containing protein [Chloroflexota bacterium]|nr:MAG: twin-arginine translocation signal domain-containing protein [Chloroflexota bacterium]
MIRPEDGLYAALTRRGMTRRAFLKFGAAMTAALALPATYAPRITAAIERAPRLPVIWLRGQACGGDTEAFLAAAGPSVGELLLDLLSVEYHETLMGTSGEAATAVVTSLADRYPDGYFAVVEGAIPTADDGMACTLGGRPFRDVVREVCNGALATIAVGACAFDGGTPASSGGATGSVGVADVAPDARLVSLPGCPMNVENLTATIAHYLAFDELPATDSRHRPYFAYGGLIHNLCERRAHFEFGEFVLAWGDEGAQKGWCLYKLGCKGPETFANCATVQYASGTSWNVKAGQGCIGCTMRRFWDAMGPAHARLPSTIPFAPTITADQIGLALVGGVAALTAVHGSATYARELRNKVVARRRAAAAGRVSADQLQDDPAPGATEPKAPEPAPSEPTPTEFAPTEPDAIDPAATDPAPADPRP